MHDNDPLDCTTCQIMFNSMASRDFNQIENLYSNINGNIYENRKQQSRNENLWEAIKTTTINVKIETGERLTKSISQILMQLIKYQVFHINMQNNKIVTYYCVSQIDVYCNTPFWGLFMSRNLC